MHSELHANLKRFVRETDGNIAIMSVAFLFSAIATCALAIDTGSLYVQRRAAQGAVDLAAMAAAADSAHAEAAARATLAANGITDVTELSVLTGHFTADPKLQPDARFQPGQEPINAARVELEKPSSQYFSKIFIASPVTIKVAGTATAGIEAAFSLGSRLAAFNGGVLNKVLGGLLGSTISLSVMDYNALVDADVKLSDFMNALAENVHLTAATYQDVLNSNPDLAQVLASLAQVCRQSGQEQAGSALDSLAHAAFGRKVALTSLIDLGSLATASVGDPSTDFGTKISAMQLVSAAALIADGTHQVSIDLAASVPGIASLKLDIAIGEPMQHSAWLAVGGNETIVQTAQTRMVLVAQVGGTSLLQGASVRLPIYVELAYAQARVANATCSAPDDGTATVAVKPGIFNANIGDLDMRLDDFNTTRLTDAKIVTAPLLQATGSAHAELGNMVENMIEFSQRDIESGTIKTTDTSQYAQSLTASLLKDLKLRVTTAGLQLNTPAALQSAIVATLTPVAAQIDKVLWQSLQMLGLHLGQADVRVKGIRCRGGVLAG